MADIYAHANNNIYYSKSLIPIHESLNMVEEDRDIVQPLSDAIVPIEDTSEYLEALYN